MNNLVKLYRSTKSLDVSVWSIWSKYSTIYIETKQTLHGSPILFTEEILEGKAGRSIEDQIKLRINSRIKVKRDHGYNEDIEKAKSGDMTNQLNLYLPMLAERFKNLKSWNISDMMVQPKLDGHRCLIARIGDEYIAYSRRGLQINTIDHILDKLNFPDGYVLDGELYCHGEALQTIASWAKRYQPNTHKLNFVCYDVISPFSEIYSDRLKFIKSEVNFSQSSMLLNTFDGSDMGEEFSMGRYLQDTINKGYEGVILRPKNGIYHIGRRHKDLVKIKKWFDAEYIVVRISESRTGMAILHMLEDNGEEFKATAPGNRMQKDHVLHNPEMYIGNEVTIEYPNKTNKGIPFQPVALRWVTKL